MSASVLGTSTADTARQEAFSDGVFSIAITLLVLAVHSGRTRSRSSGQIHQRCQLGPAWAQAYRLPQCTLQCRRGMRISVFNRFFEPVCGEIDLTAAGVEDRHTSRRAIGLARTQRFEHVLPAVGLAHANQ